jgi:Domain of unknown function (DUF3330)
LTRQGGRGGNGDVRSGKQETLMAYTEPSEASNVIVTCRACACAVPLDEAVVPEALPYVVYFCGLACFAAWHDDAARILPSLQNKEPTQDR